MVQCIVHAVLHGGAKWCRAVGEASPAPPAACGGQVKEVRARPRCATLCLAQHSRAVLAQHSAAQRLLLHKCLTFSLLARPPTGLLAARGCAVLAEMAAWWVPSNLGQCSAGNGCTNMQAQQRCRCGAVQHADAAVGQADVALTTWHRIN